MRIACTVFKDDASIQHHLRYKPDLSQPKRGAVEVPMLRHMRLMITMSSCIVELPIMQVGSVCLNAMSLPHSNPSCMHAQGGVSDMAGQLVRFLVANERLLVVAASTMIMSLSHTALRPVLPVFAKASALLPRPHP